jgi:hypothetical protein
MPYAAAAAAKSSNMFPAMLAHRTMRFTIAFCMSLVMLHAVAGAIVPRFTRADAHARLAAFSSGRVASGAECVACEEVRALCSSGVQIL